MRNMRINNLRFLRAHHFYLNFFALIFHTFALFICVRSLVFVKHFECFNFVLLSRQIACCYMGDSPIFCLSFTHTIYMCLCVAFKSFQWSIVKMKWFLIIEISFLETNAFGARFIFSKLLDTNQKKKKSYTYCTCSN